MIQALLLAALAGLPSCWNMFDAALRHSANALHPQFVSYDERIAITEDGLPLLSSLAHIDYRDDGFARVQDERFGYHPFITKEEEPGPPVLGPYGSARDMWMPLPDGLRVIADVRTATGVRCTVGGEEAYKGHDTYHLSFSGARQERPQLRDLWIDAHTDDIWKLIMTGPVTFMGDDAPALAQFQVELGYTGPYLVVNHVVWTYQRREYSQYAEYFGEYTLTGYEFPQTLPESYFAVGSVSER
jgi:hypothetical protein